MSPNTTLNLAPFGRCEGLFCCFYGSPAALFQSMANEWRGWKGEKSWNDLESSLSIKARSDSVGHTKLTVKLSEYESSFETVLIFEAGQLEEMANEITKLLP